MTLRATLPALLLATFAANAALAADTPRPFDVRDLVTLERVSSPLLSPDGRKLVVAVRQVDFAANKATTGLWIEDLFARDAAPPVRLTVGTLNVNSPAFAGDGRGVYFLSPESGSMQLWYQPLDSDEASQVTDYPLDVGSFKVSPDGTRVALSFEVFPDCADLDCTKARLDPANAPTKASGVIHDRLFVRHWDTWADGRRNQLFVADLDDRSAQAGLPHLVSTGIDGDVPSKPFGDAGEYTWSPDGQSLVFSVRIAGKTEAWSTNFDLFQVPAAGGTPRNLTAANAAMDTGPVFSADGKTLYYRAMKRPGFEADRLALMAMDVASGESREIAADWDRSFDGITLSADGSKVYTTAYDLGTHSLFAVDVADGTVAKVVQGGTIAGFDLRGDTLAYTRDTLTEPAQAFVARADGGAPRQVTRNNEDVLAKIAMGEAEQFSFKGWNDETVHGYVVKPANFVEGRTYPVAFLIHGGPQGSFGDNFHYRWNPQTYAGAGFAVVMIDFHGSTGYGQAFTDAISQHWGDRPLEDLQKGWAAAQQQYPFLDGDRACALGGSYGGYMVTWIAGNWPDGFKCLVDHAGVFDARLMGINTEELWFSEWENGGTYWDVPANYERFNPVNHIGKWQAPMLVIHGEKDYRVLVEQGLGAFAAAQRRGIDSRLLLFPDENHWILKPHNSVLWHDTVNDWLKRWTAE